MAFKHKKDLHAYVCTPAYDARTTTDFTQSITEASFCCPLYGIQLTAGVMGNGAFIDLARNIFVKKFLEEFTDCTHLFFIDADLRFEARAFVGLMKSGHPVCAGVYRRRQEPETYPFRPAENPNGGGLWFVDDWLQCNRVPTGFLCIRREVIEEAAAKAPKITIHDQNGPVPWVFHTGYLLDGGNAKVLREEWKLPEEFIAKYGNYIPLDGSRLIGEDFGFCDDYIARHGTNIPVWTNFEFTHGGYKGNMFRWLTDAKDKHDAQMSSVA